MERSLSRLFLVFLFFFFSFLFVFRYWTQIKLVLFPSMAFPPVPWIVGKVCRSSRAPVSFACTRAFSKRKIKSVLLASEPDFYVDRWRRFFPRPRQWHHFSRRASIG